MGLSAVTMQAKDDRLETDYRPHPPRAYQQGSRRTTFESLPEDAGRHGGVRTGEVFRNFRAECRCREMVFRGGGEIPLEAGAPPAGEFTLTPPPVLTPEPGLSFEQNAEALESSVAVTSEVRQAAESSANAPPSSGLERKGRRRGRRGGRNRRKVTGGREASAAPGQHVAEAPAPRRGLPA